MIGVDTERLSDVYRFDWVNGDDALLGELGTNGALVEKDIAASENLGRRRHASRASRSPAPRPTLHGAAARTRTRDLLNGFVVSNAALRAGLPPGQTGVDYIFVKDVRRRGRGDGRRPRSRPRSKQFPIAKVQTNAGVQGRGLEPGRPDPVPALRAARDERDHLALRHRQHARALDLRAHARDRDAAGDRHDPPAAAADDPLRERDHGGASAGSSASSSASSSAT